MIRVEYGVIAEGAKEGFSPTLLYCAEISNDEDILQDGLDFKNFVNPCERYSAILDGAGLPIPENTENENIGVWSLYTTNSSGAFENVFPTITLISDKSFDVDGLGLAFDIKNNIYPTEFLVSWYNGGGLVLSKKYQSASPSFSLLENIENCNKITIEFQKMNTPYSRLKLHSIQFGSILIIEEKTIRNIKLHQVVSPISTTVPISTLDLTFVNSTGANYNFTARQSLRVINNEVLVGQYFIENASQTNKKQWRIKAQDYISMLDGADFDGGIYVGELASKIINEIFNRANVPFSISESLESATVTGYIPYTNCRKALQQVLFAIGAYANTAYSETVNILEINSNVAESIGLDRILQGQNISVDADITEIELTGHSYTPIEDEITLYEAKEAGENLKIIFNEPIWELTITDGQLIDNGANYAIIDCQEGAILKGKKYEHLTFSKSRYNVNARAKTANKKTIKSATLISSYNIDNILNICYNYIVKNTTIRSKVIESETPLIVGNTYEIETDLLGKVSGVLSEQSFSLFGGQKIAKETVIK